jgi:tRNA modification GTPase
MPRDVHTRVVELTPAGRGAVATVLVEGPRARELVGRFFHSASGRKLDEAKRGRILFGRWQAANDDETAGEELVICPTSEQTVEVHCHGGRAAVRRVVDALSEAGGQVMGWPDWLSDHEPSLFSAEARIALAEATTRRTSLILLDQYHGALQREVRAINALVAEGELGQAVKRLEKLLERATWGQHLTRPWRVVLAGHPNVGKSSLINALVGYERAIVTPVAGTTRDVVTAAAALDGWPVELADTAGLRTARDDVEAAGVERAHEQIEAADLLLLVFDRSKPWSGEDCQLAERYPQAVVIHNKSDLKQNDAGRPEGEPLSATTNTGVDALIATIVDRLVPAVPSQGAAVPFTERQVSVLEQARSALVAGHPDAAREVLDSP